MAADALSRVFSALADPTRRDMVARLTAGDATVNELAAPYDVSLQAVSKHLRVLDEPAAGVWAGDRSGVIADLDLPASPPGSWDPQPIG